MEPSHTGSGSNGANGHGRLAPGGWGLPLAAPPSSLEPRRLLIQEARSMLTRLDRVKSFALYETMVPAAAASLAAQNAMERYMATRRAELQRLVGRYLHWLQNPPGSLAPVDEGQRRLALLRMRFNLVLSHFDIFADVMTQRSEHETGVWLAGLDAVAADALHLPGYYDSPPVMCYLDRGHGAAIRRARTRLPGGGENPVAIIRVPRERMVGSGVASSLVHEVGHQGAALLDLVASLRPALRQQAERAGASALAWQCFERWISEIVADFWSASKVGIAAPMGLLGVVSLPRAFVFRISLDDPHPIPWIRVKLSCAMGKRLYPHPQWDALSQAWQQFYPPGWLDEPRQALFAALEAGIPAFVDLLVAHRPASLGGKSLGEVFALPDRATGSLQAGYAAWRSRKLDLRRQPPARVFALIGQARADGKITPQGESRLVADLLSHWALRSTLDASELCEAARVQAPARAV